MEETRLSSWLRSTPWGEGQVLPNNMGTLQNISRPPSPVSSYDSAMQEQMARTNLARDLGVSPSSPAVNDRIDKMYYSGQLQRPTIGIAAPPPGVGGNSPSYESDNGLAPIIGAGSPVPSSADESSNYAGMPPAMAASMGPPPGLTANAARTMTGDYAGLGGGDDGAQTGDYQGVPNASGVIAGAPPDVTDNSPMLPQVPSALAPSRNPALIPIAQGAPPPPGAVTLPASATPMDPNDPSLQLDNTDSTMMPPAGRTQAMAALQQQAVQAANAVPDDTRTQIAALLKDSAITPQDKWIALGRAGLGMMASRNPYFLGALGEGGEQGLSAYQAAQQRALAGRAKAIGALQTEAQRQETGRSNLAREGLTGQQIAETSADRKARIDMEAARSREAAQARRDVAQTYADQRRDAAADRQSYLDAMAGRGKFTVAGTNSDGDIVLVDQTSGESKIVPGVKPKPSGSANSGAFAARQAAMKAAGYTDQQIGDVAAGKKTLSPAEIELRATQTAKAKSATAVNPMDQTRIFNETYEQVKSGLGGGAPAGNIAPVPSAAPQAPAAPALSGRPGSSKAMPLVPTVQSDIDKAPSGTWIQTPNGPMQKP